MYLKAAIAGNLRSAMDAEVLKVAGALRRAVTTTGQQVQGELRAQARAGGFRDGGRAVGNAWRLNVFPRPGVGPRTFRPAAVVWSRMPKAVEAFDSGKPIRAKNRRFLAVPTEVNFRGARRGRQLRVTAEQMANLEKAFVLPVDSRPGVFLWCLPLEQQRTKRGRLRLFVGGGTEVFTGRVKGLQALRESKAAEGFVVLFILLRKLSLRKRLNVAQVRARAARLYAVNATNELGRLPR
jgi:hypothetical protein